MEGRRVVGVDAGGIARCGERARQLLRQHMGVMVSVFGSHVARARFLGQSVDQVRRHNRVTAAGQQVAQRAGDAILFDSSDTHPVDGDVSGGQLGAAPTEEEMAALRAQMQASAAQGQ